MYKNSLQTVANRAIIIMELQISYCNGELNMEKIDQHSHSLLTNQKWVLATTSAGFALENMDVLFLSFAMSSMIADLHLAGGAAGLISSITNLGMLFGGIVFGMLGDKVGRAKTFNYTIVIFSLATGLLAIANNIYMIYILRFIAGIGAGGEYGVGIALIADSFSRKQIGKMTSIAAVGGQIGAIIAAIISAWIIPLFGWHMLFLIGIIPIGLTFVIKRHVHEKTISDIKQVTSSSEKDQGIFKQMFSTPRLAWQSIGLMIMMTVQIAGYFCLMNWLPTIVQKQLNLNVSSSSLWMIVTIIGMSIGMLVFGSIFDYFGSRLAFTIFLLGSAAMVYALSLANNMITLLAIGAVMGFFSNGMFGGYGAVISQLYPEEIRSTANNLIVNVGRAIGGFSSVIIGILMDYGSIALVMGFLSSLYIFSFIILLTLTGLRKLAPNRK